MRSRSWHSRVGQRFDAKARPDDQIVDLAIEMAATGEARPQWIESILPARDAWLWRPPVLDEEERAGGLQHAAHLG